MMKNRDLKNLSLPLSSANLPATVSGINRNSPSRASIKAVLPPVIPSASKDDATANSSGKFKHPGPVRQMNQSEQPVTVHSSNSQFYYDVNNYLSLKPSMQQIPEQSTISMFNTYVDEPHTFEAERVSPSSVNDQFKYRYSSSSLDSGRGSDSIKLTTGQSNRVSVHSCESIGSSSSNKESETSQQSSSLSSSSSTSSSFCSSSSSSSSSSYQNPYYNRNLSSSVSSNIDSITPIGDCPTANNVFAKNNPVTSSNMISNIPHRKSNSDVGNIQSLVAQAGPPSIAEMILHGISDPEIIHNWLQKIQMSSYEKNFIDAAYDMATIARMTPQDLIAIGITDPQIRRKLTTEIQKLNVPEGLPSYKPDSLEEWLKLINLYCYYGDLCQQGYSTIDKVTELTWEDLEDVGINKLGHQKKIILAIKKIKSCKPKFSNYDSVNENKPNCTPISPVKSDEIYSNKSKVFANSANAHTMSNVERPKIMTANNNSYQLPYQDVAIKMYANNNLNSPTNPEATTFEACSIVVPNNIVPSSLFNSKPQMRTFQQTSPDNSRLIMHNPNNLIDDCSALVPQQTNNIYGASNHNSYLVSNASLASRGRSLESLNNPNISNYCLNNEQAYYNAQYYNYYPNAPLNNKPPYQYSNGDLYNNVQRQTICCETNSPLMNTFAGNQVAMPNYEIDGTATLNRPKNLIKNKPVAKIVASSRQQDMYDGYDSASLKSNDSSKFCQNSDSGSDTGSVYSTLKKKPPPPPPKRLNSIYKPNSLPSTPLASPFDQPNQIYSNTNFYDEVINSYNALQTEDLFASCVKNLTSKFSEIHSLSSNEDDEVKNVPTGPVSAPNNYSNAAHSNTLPMNKKEFNLIENVNENIYNISSSSSTESMPFANDNMGTIRQKSSNFMLNALKFSDTSSKPSSSSSSSSSTSSPMYNKNLSLPNSAINSPSAVNSFQLHQSFESLNNNNQPDNFANNSSSRQNVVESLEDIEIMLANLKTQLDSIE